MQFRGVGALRKVSRRLFLRGWDSNLCPLEREGGGPTVYHWTILPRPPLPVESDWCKRRLYGWVEGKVRWLAAGRRLAGVVSGGKVFVLGWESVSGTLMRVLVGFSRSNILLALCRRPYRCQDRMAGTQPTQSEQTAASPSAISNAPSDIRHGEQPIVFQFAILRLSTME